MCGNFGLIVLGQTGPPVDDKKGGFNVSSHQISVHNAQRSARNEEQLTAKTGKSSKRVVPATAKDMSELDRSMGASMHRVSKLKGFQYQDEAAEKDDILISPLKILEAQTSNTEIRGGQAGGFSTLEYTYQRVKTSSEFDAMFSAKTIAVPRNTRVRCVALKRYPLAADIAKAYLSARSGRLPDTSGCFSAIGHTRFATSSVNIASELHPHEWVPFHDETVWLFDPATGRFGRSVSQVGIHITHNGDFDELEAYGHVMLNGDLGLWLTRILYCSSTALLGDSPKFAGMMDLMRVQGRWGPAARAAWMRCVLRNPSDVADGEQLSPDAPNTFPEPHFWDEWHAFLDRVWTKHINNVILVKAPRQFDVKRKHTYAISYKGTKQLCNAIIDELLRSTEHLVPHHDHHAAGDHQTVNNLHADESSEAYAFGISHWKMPTLRAFVHHTVRGFLHADLYTSLTEFLSRATGSFGLQTHCTLEPGVAVIASKGQPMSLSYDPIHPIVLFGSEAEAMAVPVFESGKWLPRRLDLDNKGEIIRIGPPRALQEGTFATAEDHVSNATTAANQSKGGKSTLVASGASDAAAGRSSASGRGGDFSDTSLPATSSFSSSGAPKRASSKVVAFSNGADEEGPTDRMEDDDEAKGGGADDTPLWKKEGAVGGSSKRSGKLKLSLASLGRSHSSILGTKVGMMLECGIELRSYSLVTRAEATQAEMERRTVIIPSAPLPYDPSIDLVARDLAITPAVLAAIDDAWRDPFSIESMAGRALSNQLVQSMQRRIKQHDDTTDLVIAGIEASVWLAEQFAADVRRFFPQLNVVCTSTNKLIGFGDDNPSQVFFPAADEVLFRRIDPQHTCILLISQSGQTFSSLHATRKLAQHLPERLWILTGCFNSKMEQVLKERYQEIGKPYRGNRVFNNYSGHRPAEPTSVAVAAAWHSLTRMLLHLVHTCRRRMPGGRLIHPWDYDRAAVTIQAWFMEVFAAQKVREVEARSASKKQKKSISERMAAGEELGSDTDEGSSDDDEGRGRGKGQGAVDTTGSKALMALAGSPSKLQRSNTRRASTQIYQMDPLAAVRAKAAAKSGAGSDSKEPEAPKKRLLVMKLSDGCIADLENVLQESLLPTISEAVGYDVDGNPLHQEPADAGAGNARKGSFMSHQQKLSGLERKLSTMNSYDKGPMMTSTRGMSSKSAEEKKGAKEKELTVHDQLVLTGRMWGDHVNEPWNVMILAGFYVLISVALGLPLWSLVGDAIYALLKNIPAVEAYVGSSGLLMMPMRYPSVWLNQPIGYSLVGLFLQIVDAIWFIYIGKHITRLLRIAYGRPFHARMGKRTIVIVDNPTVHQLLENFVSKLYSQSYSVNGVDVHGASGLDHFVHRFTHRVVRGVLLAVGRPDGRLCCLAKSEASLLLAVKQAAFIQNPKFKFDGSGPDIITLGHNPYQPNVGLAHHVVLNGSRMSASKAAGASGGDIGLSQHGISMHGGLDLSTHPDRHGQLNRQTRGRRRKFVDEYLYDRLFIAQKPFTISILRTLRNSFDQEAKETQSVATSGAIERLSMHGGGKLPKSVQARINQQQQANNKKKPTRQPHPKLRNLGARPNSPRVDGLGLSVHSKHGQRLAQTAMFKTLPYGVHHIDPSILAKAESIEASVFADFVLANKDMLTRKVMEKGLVQGMQRSSDPGVRLAFSGKLDAQARQIQDLQVNVQQFYECRVASLERYIAFCVMFHAMAQSCCQPWMSVPWDMARSQSNLRVATTASPISVGAGESEGSAKSFAQRLANRMRRFQVNF